MKTALVMSAIVLGSYILLGLLAKYHPDYKQFSRWKLLLISIEKAIWPILAGSITIFLSQPHFKNILDPLKTPVGFTLLGLFFGTSLLILRNQKREIYGQIEIGFSIITFAWIGFTYGEIDIAQSAIAFAGSVYVFVRGCTNIQDSKKVA